MYADTGHYKIGVSLRPEERLRSFKTEMPVDVRIVHTFPASDMYLVENTLHNALKELRYRGEWFLLNDEIVEWFCSIYRVDENGVELIATPDEVDDVKRLVQIIEKRQLPEFFMSGRDNSIHAEESVLAVLFIMELQEHDPSLLKEEGLTRFYTAVEAAEANGYLESQTVYTLGSKRDFGQEPGA